MLTYKMDDNKLQRGLGPSNYQRKLLEKITEIRLQVIEGITRRCGLNVMQLGFAEGPVNLWEKLCRRYGK